MFPDRTERKLKAGGEKERKKILTRETASRKERNRAHQVEKKKSAIDCVPNLPSDVKRERERSDATKILLLYVSCAIQLENTFIARCILSVTGGC